MTWDTSRCILCFLRLQRCRNVTMSFIGFSLLTELHIQVLTLFIVPPKNTHLLKHIQNFGFTYIVSHLTILPLFPPSLPLYLVENPARLPFLPLIHFFLRTLSLLWGERFCLDTFLLFTRLPYSGLHTLGSCLSIFQSQILVFLFFSLSLVLRDHTLEHVIISKLAFRFSTPIW